MNGASCLRSSLAAAALLAGCSGPNQANILLRKQNQALTQQVEELQRHNAGLAAQLAVDENNPGATTPQLPESRLDKLYTTHGLAFGRETGGFSNNPTGPDQMVKVAVYPTDQDGDALKAAGSVKIELFDLAEPDTRLGTWNFSPDEAKPHWYGHVFLYMYIFDLPWQTMPKHTQLVLQATFTDELTGRQFTAKRDIEVRLH